MPVQELGHELLYSEIPDPPLVSPSQFRFRMEEHTASAGLPAERFAGPHLLHSVKWQRPRTAQPLPVANPIPGRGSSRLWRRYARDL